ncbi:6bc30193-a2fb-47cb-8c06-a30b14e506c9 [Sclerotinia trifoliorum]|uniref:6bc30193-a2fb-47cb-8c06-a30b14e506c9 n=1 Tax=Sclerotinia trifoliorum TaxID=28548 RepID=A0A8H2VNN9_9HELO|nr:6bc30193-a2fb-47cb-8c06-a30b14e506c9 [Sclerotinia trifoliorum]
MYHCLQSLQGRFIPCFYGEAIYDGSPALVLSEIIGRKLYDLTMKYEEHNEFERKLEEVYKALIIYGITHRDPALYNAIDVGNRIMIVDLEQSRTEEIEWEESINKGNAGYLMYQLQLNRQYEEEEMQRKEEAMKTEEEEIRKRMGKSRLPNLAYSGRREEDSVVLGQGKG